MTLGVSAQVSLLGPWLAVAVPPELHYLVYWILEPRSPGRTLPLQRTQAGEPTHGGLQT